MDQDNAAYDRRLKSEMNHRCVSDLASVRLS